MENTYTKQNPKTSLLGLFLDAYGLCICTYEFYNNLIIILFYDNNMCMYVRMDYPCRIYVFIFTIFAPWSVMCRSLVGNKNYGCHWNLNFSFSLRQYYVIYCCFKDFSTPQGVICKLSFFKFSITVRFTDKIQTIYSITRKIQLLTDLFYMYTFLRI